jgi:hypothetical protein
MVRVMNAVGGRVGGRVGRKKICSGVIEQAASEIVTRMMMPTLFIAKSIPFEFLKAQENILRYMQGPIVSPPEKIGERPTSFPFISVATS